MAIDKYLRIKQVCELTGLSRATIYALKKTGGFPEKTALGVRAVAWRESEIVGWMDTRTTAVKSGREAKPGRPPVRKIDLSKQASESPADPNATKTSLKAEKYDIAPEPISDSCEWPDEIDMPTLPKPDLRPNRSPKRFKVSKENSATVKRRGETIDLLADFNIPGSKSKPGK